MSAHEITVNRVDTDTSFHMTFVPLDGEGQPTHPTGAIQVTNSNSAVCSAVATQDDPSSPQVVLVTLTHAVGNSDIVVHDQVATVTAHLIVSSGAEVDATLVVSA